jgi:hypothetical protein
MIAPPKPPAHDEPELLIKEARERQLRRRLLGAAGVAVVAALGLAVYAVTSDGGDQVVSGSPVGAPPLCHSSDLSTTAGLNGATGTMLGPVTLTNIGGSACSLPTGRPRVRIVWQGRVLPARETGGKNFAPAPPVHILAPHARAAIFIDWSNWCGKPGTGTVIRPTFQLRWADGLGVNAVDSPALTPPRCNAAGTEAAILVSAPERD